MIYKRFIINFLLLFICLSFAFSNAELTQNDWNNYAKNIDYEIKSNWKVSPFSKIYKIILSFDISKSGEFSNIKILQSSGSEKEDKNAINAVMTKSGMFPLPKDYDGDFINIKIVFNSAVLGGKVDKMKEKYKDNLWFNPWGAF